MIAAHDFYENDFARFWISGGILFFEYKPNTTIDLRVAQCVVTDRIHFQNECTYPILCDIRGVVATEKAGRDHLARYTIVRQIQILASFRFRYEITSIAKEIGRLKN